MPWKSFGFGPIERASQKAADRAGQLSYFRKQKKYISKKLYAFDISIFLFFPLFPPLEMFAATLLWKSIEKEIEMMMLGGWW